MNVVAPPSAFFLPERKGQNSGVDFLGLRQANLDMMGDLVPGTNNVTAYIRPFSLLSWIYWKFHALCVNEKISGPTRKNLLQFRERIEILFTWGARLADYPRIPGKQAEPPFPDAQGTVPLTFADWKRVESSTSLIAALWYGPASKVVTGLGFLMPVAEGVGFYRTVGPGVKLAQALDARMRGEPERYKRLLATLDGVRAAEDDARALWQLWSPATAIVDEQDAFRTAFHDPGAIGDYQSLMGKRSSTLALARLHLMQAGCSQMPDDIRTGMLLSQRPDGTVYEVPPKLKGARDRWIMLQVRQLQRLTLESLLSWTEARILEGSRDTAELVDAYTREWEESDYPLTSTDRLSDALATFDATFSTLDEFVARCRDGTLPSPLILLDAIHEGVANDGEGYAAHCFYGLLLCAAFAGCVDQQSPELRLGGPGRISLYHLRKRLKGLATASIREAISYVLEAMVISQHFSTAVNRFDGRNQRLRLAIEETGLESLVGTAWQPTVTEDRLPMLLSLAADCQLLGREKDGGYVAA